MSFSSGVQRLLRRDLQHHATQHVQTSEIAASLNEHLPLRLFSSPHASATSFGVLQHLPGSVHRARARQVVPTANSNSRRT